MKSFQFENEHAYHDDKALVSVRLLGTRIPTWVQMTIDTGAEISVLNRSLASQLRLKVEEGRSVGLKVANGDIAAAYVHEVAIDFVGRRLTIPVLICPEWDTENLLGMRGFLDQMVIAFDHAQKRIYF